MLCHGTFNAVQLTYSIKFVLPLENFFMKMLWKISLGEHSSFNTYTYIHDWGVKCSLHSRFASKFPTTTKKPNRNRKELNIFGFFLPKEGLLNNEVPGHTMGQLFWQVELFFCQSELQLLVFERTEICQWKVLVSSTCSKFAW